jgi:hypothetical protein
MGSVLSQKQAAVVKIWISNMIIATTIRIQFIPIGRGKPVQMKRTEPEGRAHVRPPATVRRSSRREARDKGSMDGAGGEVAHMSAKGVCVAQLLGRKTRLETRSST